MKLIGIVTAVAECKTMLQINVDVLPKVQGNNLATIAVNMITKEVLKRGYIPYYSTSMSNVHSLRFAVKAGYIHTWSHSFRMKFDLLKE